MSLVPGENKVDKMLYDFACINGHQKEIYFKRADHVGCETVICKCRETMTRLFSPGKGMAWIEEGRPRTFHNIGPEPITVTSRKQYREALKKHGVAEAGCQITSDNNNHTRKVTVTAKGRWI